jgi:hypothetical protein
MKNLILLIFLITFTFSIKAQSYEEVSFPRGQVEYKYEKQYNGDIYVYKYENHIKKPFPVKMIVKQLDGSYLVYKVKNGVRNSIPEGKISKNNNRW